MTDTTTRNDEHPNDFGITIDSTYEGFEVEDGWEHNAWTVTVTRDPFSMTIPFRMGTGLVGEPSLRDILECLQSDARICEYEEWDDVLCEMPYSKARKIVEQGEHQTEQLRTMLGDDFQAFLDHDFDNEED